jgi:hypothetical protein
MNTQEKIKEIEKRTNDKMTQLKTLKDLMSDVDNYHQSGEFKIECLKQEAIKWVKEWNDDLHDECSLFMEECWIIKWIKHFFNLTAEDLK